MTDRIELVNTGGWAPPGGVARVPLFAWPPKPWAAFKWFVGLPGYLLPWNVFYVAVALGAWLTLMPDLAAMKNFELGWIAQLLIVNAGLVFAFTEAWHWLLYARRAQDMAFKYDESWPKPAATFLFGDQHIDNRIWTMLSAVPVMTGFMAFILWAMASGTVPTVSWQAHPLYLAAVMLGVQLFRDVHFYVIHRLIHWPPLYRWVHFLHHKNANPGPWSGLAMHPVEHVLYFSSVLIHLVVPSDPVIVVYHLIAAAFGPARDHCGFATVMVNGKPRIQAASYMHYLHHRYFEVNYGDSMTPIDWWVGTGHDGSRAAHEAMKRRLRKAKMRAPQSAE